MPPNTELIVVIPAKYQILLLLAKHIGINMTSGGIGKKEDSEKLNANKYLSAFGILDQLIIFLYKKSNIFIYYYLFLAFYERYKANRSQSFIIKSIDISIDNH